MPPGFEPPNPDDHPRFRFEPLGPEHNAADLDAWSSSSIDLIHATRGFRPGGWPKRPYILADNLVDLEQHRDHHERGTDFPWTVLDPTDGTVIGCVYLKPDPTGAADAEARSWARADRAELDGELREHLRPWFVSHWPFPCRRAQIGQQMVGMKEQQRP